MRICMITSAPMPPAEGVGYYVWNLSRFLLGHGHQVTVITRGQRGKPSFEEFDELPIWRPRFYPVYPLHVHLHGLFVQRLVRRLESDIDIFHLHTPLPPPVHSRRPILLTVHSMMLADARARRTSSILDFVIKMVSLVSHRIERRLLGISGTVTAVSRVAAQHAQCCRTQDSQVKITWNGVDTHFFSPNAHNPIDYGHLLFVGRLAPGKGLGDLVQALKLVVSRYPGTRISIAGDGPLRGKVISMIKRSGLDEHVGLLGHVDSRLDLRALYRGACALVLPSHHESLPTVALEAMACGTPVIATRVGSVPDIITDSANGLLVPSRAPEQLAEAICRMLSDPALRTRLGAAARHTVEKSFSWQVVGDNYLRCYQSLLKGGLTYAGAK